MLTNEQYLTQADTLIAYAKSSTNGGDQHHSIFAADAIRELVAANQELAKDAARYRWLCYECEDVDIKAGIGWLSQDVGIDAAIDKEMEKTNA